MTGIDPTMVGIMGFVVFIVLLLVGVHLGIGMCAVGFFGIVILKGLKISLSTLFLVPYSTTASWIFSVVPMFVLMGSIAYHAGFTRDAYNTAYRWVGRLPGGIAMATLMGAAAFGACSGSSLAATASLGRLAVPEMKRFGYNKKLSAGVVAMGGTLSALIPPSILLVLYGVITEEGIGELLIAGILPGILTMAVFCLLVFVWAKFKPRHAPKGEVFTWKERLSSLKNISGILVLFAFVAGGIYTGVFTPTEAGAAGAFVILLMSFFMKRLTRSDFKAVISETLGVVAQVFLIIIGAHIFNQFLALTRLPIDFANYIVALEINRYLVIVAVIFAYTVMGCFLDSLGMLFLTVPFVAPAIHALGFDMIWFGIIVVKLIEIALLTPPVGVQAYILKGVAPEMTLSDIFIGFIPFFLVDIILVLGLLIVFPQIATFLPSLM